jgi:protocatechuate 3,4-dioxygenase, alpha subunit
VSGPTPAQTVGPFLHIAMDWPDGPYAVVDGTPGAVWLHGRLLDGEGEPVPDGIIETWQADPDGRFDHPHDPRGPAHIDGFRGFGRSCTRADGGWEVLTLKPGPLPAEDGAIEAPHVDVSVFARGLLHRLVTRIYFDDEAELNAADPTLSTVEPGRRRTLVAQHDERGYHLDFRLQGDDESVFFDV